MSRAAHEGVFFVEQLAVFLSIVAFTEVRSLAASLPVAKALGQLDVL